ncbi:MAG: DUF927 domain-containing protein [Clostridia bacterium]|nr:DUF927 domain-containing protein [Clostridia bacterium]
MAISTDATIQAGSYGVIKTIKKSQYFKPYGKAIYLDEISENIEDGNVFLTLSTDFQGKTKIEKIFQGQLTNPSTAELLANKGFQITKKSFDIFADTILLQMDEYEANGFLVKKVYKNLGWITLPRPDGKRDLCYRAHKLIGNQRGAYIGEFDVEPLGSFDEWKTMVERDILGHDVLDLTVVASLSAVVNGLISPFTNGENPIIHLCLDSSKGKTTACEAATSTMGRPFEGVIVKTDNQGQQVRHQSLLQSWGATDNATITSQAGNQGAVTILNELGKNLSKNMTQLIFNLSEGSDKKRLTTDLKSRVSERFSTVFISNGESSLLERCSAKLEGLAIRVMEIRKPITDSAEHSNRIKETCRKHCGHAVPLLAEHIISKGGIGYVMPIYKKWLEKLKEDIPKSHNQERFVEKFATLFVTTAEIAKDALGISFDTDRIINFLIEHENENGKSRNVALESYEKILGECRTNINSFYHGEHVPNGKIYGKINEPRNKTHNGKKIAFEYIIRKTFVEEILKKYNFPNVATCAKAWSDAGVISRDKDRPTRSRKIEPNGDEEEVFVLITYRDEAESDPPRSKLVKLKSQAKVLLADKKGGENNDAINSAGNC